MERCPACRARLNNQPVCPRCGCDLNLVFTAQNQSEIALRQAVSALVNSQPELAFRLAALALKLDANTMTVIFHHYLHERPPRKALMAETASTKVDQMNQALDSLRQKMLKRFK